jgi:hypothetical protein
LLPASQLVAKSIASDVTNVRYVMALALRSGSMQTGSYLYRQSIICVTGIISFSLIFALTLMRWGDVCNVACHLSITLDLCAIPRLACASIL